MTWGATFDVPGTLEDYDQIVPMVDQITHGLAAGCLLHFVSPTDSGYRVTEVWRSEEDWRRFRNDVLTPLLQRLTGDEQPPQPDPVPFAVHAVKTATEEA